MFVLGWTVWNYQLSTIFDTWQILFSKKGCGNIISCPLYNVTMLLLLLRVLLAGDSLVAKEVRQRSQPMCSMDAVASLQKIVLKKIALQPQFPKLFEVGDVLTKELTVSWVSNKEKRWNWKVSRKKNTGQNNGRSVAERKIQDKIMVGFKATSRKKTNVNCKLKDSTKYIHMYTTKF